MIENTAFKAEPLVTVVTTILNGAKYLEQCIRSVLEQSYPRIEHVFIDGGSTDDTLRIISRYQSQYPGRIRFISEHDNIAAEAWNKGLAMAKGDILGWLGADDTYEPGAIMTVVEFFRNNLGDYFVFGGCNVIDENGDFVRKFMTRDFNLDEAINDTCYIPTPAAFYRKEVIEKVGLVDTTLHVCDLDYWIRAGKIYKIYRIEPVLANFRSHVQSITGVKSADKMNALEGYRVMRRYGGRFFSPRMLYYLVYCNPVTSRMAPAFKPVWHTLRKLTGR
jgi:glycosyltransferase involved in cell wall biosynthesis